MLRAVTSLVAPPLCGLCDRPLPVKDRICEPCGRELARLGPVHSAVRGLAVSSAARYEGAARRLVAKLKFSGRLDAGRGRRGGDGPVLEPRRDRACWSRCRDRRPAPGGAASTPHAFWRRRSPHETGLPGCSLLARADGPRQVGRPRRDRLDRPAPGLGRWGRPDARAASVARRRRRHDRGDLLVACTGALRAAGVERAGAVTFARADSLGVPRQAA